MTEDRRFGRLRGAGLAVLLLIAIPWTLGTAPPALGHDTWVQCNTQLIRLGDAVYVDLKLGNHGNDHRDFKLASKIDLESCTLEAVDPDGRSYDLKPGAVDMGYAPKEGYWQSRFVTGRAGLHMVSHTLDKVVNHGRAIRAVKSGKTFFIASSSLDNVQGKLDGFDRVLGHPLELVPVRHPVVGLGPGAPIQVRLLFHGRPLEGARVTFVPQGVELSSEFDERYERLTNARGEASFTPKAGNFYLAVVHHRAPDESGPTYESTAYSATLVVLVPESCPCCSE